MGRKITIITIAVLSFASCSIQGLFTKKEDDNTLLFASLLLSQSADPCFNVSKPIAGATTQSGYGVGSGFSVLTGRVVTQSGASVIAANIVAVSSPTDYVATFTGLGGDGSFYLSGVNPGASYRLAVEPIGNDFTGRIDTFIDCYQSPYSFTPGWYAGDGATTEPIIGMIFTSPIAGDVSDLGVIRILE